MGNLPKKQIERESMAESAPKTTAEQITITNTVDFTGAAFVLAFAIFAFAYLEVGVVFENSKGETGAFLSITKDIW